MKLRVAAEIVPDATAANARLRVRVLDVTEADAASRVVAEAPVREVPAGHVEVELDLDEELDPGRSYALWAHWDRGGTGKVKRGDQLTTQSFPIDPRRPQPLYAIRLTPV